MVKLLQTDHRWYRDRLAAILACALVAMAFTFALLPSAARASAAASPTQCSGIDGSQGPLFFAPSPASPYQSNAALDPTPSAGSTVSPGSTVYAVYHDETRLLESDGQPSAGKNFSFTITGPNGPSSTITPVSPTFLVLDPKHTDADANGFNTMVPKHDDAWIPNSGIHPDQEFNHVVKISGVIPTSITIAGTYTVRLQTDDGDNNGSGGDCGFAQWSLHLVPNFTLTKTVDEGNGTNVVVGTTLHYHVTVHNTSTFTDTAPAISEHISGTATHTVVSGPTVSQGSISGSDPSWSWSPGTLAGGASATLTLNVKITSTGDLTNTAANGDDIHSVINHGTKAQPGIQTTPSAGGVIGTNIHDSALVSGGVSPTGTVTFNLYGPSDATCAGTAVFTDTKALGVNSADYTTAAVGTYHWTATYSGDANNLTATSACADESATVTSPPASGTLAATIVAPALPQAGAGPGQLGTGRSDLGMRMFLALMLVLAIASALAWQAISPARNERD